MDVTSLTVHWVSKNIAKGPNPSLLEEYYWLKTKYCIVLTVNSP